MSALVMIDFYYIFQKNYRNNNLLEMINIELQMTKTPRICVDLGRRMVHSRESCITTTLNDLNRHFSIKNEKIWKKMGKS